MTFKIVVADDHPAMRHMVKMILSEDEEMEVIGEAGDGLALLNLLSTSRVLPDLAIIDISMPVLQGFETARRIKLLYPDIKILLLTIHEEKEYVSQGFLAGAEGYLLKEEAETCLLTAIDCIRRGNTYRSLIANNSVH